MYEFDEFTFESKDRIKESTAFTKSRKEKQTNFLIRMKILIFFLKLDFYIGPHGKYRKKQNKRKQKKNQKIRAYHFIYLNIWYL